MQVGRIRTEKIINIIIIGWSCAREEGEYDSRL
jgi:hypothetical protein